MFFGRGRSTPFLQGDDNLSMKCRVKSLFPQTGLTALVRRIRQVSPTTQERVTSRWGVSNSSIVCPVGLTLYYVGLLEVGRRQPAAPLKL